MPTSIREMDFPRIIQKRDDPRRDWREINKLTELVKKLQTEVHRLSSGVTELRLRPTLKEGGGSPTNIRQMRVKTVGDDALTCVYWAGPVLGGALDEINPTDGIDDLAEWTVAKPWRLRRTPFHNRTVRIPLEYSPGFMSVKYTYFGPSARSALNVGAGTVERQYILPRYVKGDLIYVGRADATGIGTPGIDAVEWVDLNVDGRAWAAHLTDP